MNLLVELDLSQAESRIVDGASGDRRALELARTPPDQLDQHALFASEVLTLIGDERVEASEVSKRDRNVVGKKGRHATNYGEGGVVMSDSLIKETEGEIVLAPEECDAIIAAGMRARPYIPAWQAWVRDEGLEHGKLVNSWGAELLVRLWQVSPQDYKQWYAWGPQGEVGRLAIRHGVVPVRRYVRRERLRTQVVAQQHDSVVLDGPVEELWPVAQEALRWMTREREYPGLGGPWTLAMPCGMKVGANWKEMHEWTVAPVGKQGREEFTETVRARWGACTG